MKMKLITLRGLDPRGGIAITINEDPLAGLTVVAGIIYLFWKALSRR